MPYLLLIKVPAHEPEKRRQALRDGRPLIPENHIPNLDAGLADQVDALISGSSADADADLLAAQAKAGFGVGCAGL